jgi:hypothetical protein
MNLFRSEEHVRQWAKFNPDFEKNLRSLAFWVDVFAGEMFRARSRSDYVSWLRSDAGKAAAQTTMAKLQ